VAVDDLHRFHKENISLNKAHYPYTGRIFKEKFIAFFSKYGARVHFNTFKLEGGNSLTYGVIKKQDLLQDLRLWETLLCSSFMMRPYEQLKADPDVEMAQRNNLRSAAAMAGLLTKNGASEVDYYRNIVSIPHFQTYPKLFKLVDNEDPDKMVTSQLEQFKEIYDPIIKQNFEDSFSIQKGVFTRDEGSSVTKYLLSHLNDNIHQNINKALSPLKYDTDKKFHKKTMTRQHIYEKIDDKLANLEHGELTKKLHRSIDKILLAHRNSKIFLILMSGPFLIAFYVFKYALKILIFYYFLKGKKKPKNDEKQVEEPHKGYTPQMEQIHHEAEEKIH
jgi:hypothetical protein